VHYIKKWACALFTQISLITIYRLTFCNKEIKHEDFPVYLGVKFDRSLTYKAHLTSTAAKVKTRVNLINRLAGTSWGSSADVLRTSTLSLVYSTAEYCAPAWAASRHTKLVDVQLNRPLRTISGTIKPTNTEVAPSPMPYRAPPSKTWSSNAKGI
jgi:hypothetical protein